MSHVPPHDLSVHEVKALLDRHEDVVLLDCRQPAEHALVHLPGSILVPIDEIPERVGELDSVKDRRIVVYCHHGHRSAMVADWLRGQGFPLVQNMVGGLEAWSVTIDTTVLRY